MSNILLKYSCTRLDDECCLSVMLVRSAFTPLGESPDGIVKQWRAWEGTHVVRLQKQTQQTRERGIPVESIPQTNRYPDGDKYGVDILK